METSSSFENFLNVWHKTMIGGAVAFALIGIAIYIFHKIKLASIKGYKEKYDYLSINEIRLYRLIYIIFGVAAALLVNTYKDTSEDMSIVWFFVRLFISICVGTLIGYVSSLVLNYYYPGRLQKELDKWRYMPRINPATGNKMKLLSEAEEDVHLDEGMQAEEDVFSVDYDVWIDEETGTTKIDKYPGYLEALQCGSCGFRTLRIAREEIVEPATIDKEGELLKHYECTYCKAKRTTAFKIARLEGGEANYIASLTKPKPASPETEKIEDKIDAVSIKLHSSNGVSKWFEFQGLEQAQQFLDNIDESALK